jgi:transposase
MDVTYSHCAGLDVHKKTVVACCLTPGPNGQLVSETRTFGTMTHDLLALSDWLTSKGITHVAMEATGEFWKPLYNLLEALFVVLVVNAQHIKNVPGRKTDMKDAAWIAELLRHGLLRGSFIPPLPQRDLRDLTRQRTNLIQQRAMVVNHLQKVLEWANLKLASVASNVAGVSARAMLTAMVEGEADPALLAELAQGRLRAKREALEQALAGFVREHHRFLLGSHLTHLDFLDEQVEVFDRQISQLVAKPSETEATASQERPAVSEPVASRGGDAPLEWQEAVTLLDTIPGVGKATAELVVAEIGTDMGRFPSAGHLASWARVSPGNNQSAGKRYSARTGPGNSWLRSGLVQAAHAAVRVKDSYFAKVYRRLVVRRGVKKAIMAVAHRLLVAIYYMLLRHEPYRAPGEAILDEQRKAQLADRMQHRLAELGYTVSLEPKHPVVA